MQDIAPQGSAQREEFIPLLIIGGIKLAEFAFTAYEAKQLKDAYDRGEITNDDLAKMAATSAATSAAGIIPIPGSSAAAKIFAKAAGRMENRAAARVEKSVADVNPEQAGGSAGKLQSAEMPDGDVTQNNKLEVGVVESYGKSKKITGDGTVDREHNPPKQALLERARQLKGEDLTAEEKRRIINESYTITLPKDIHQKASSSKGYSSERAVENSKDLQEATKNYSKEHIENSINHESHQVIKDACGKINCKTNDQYDTFISSILGGKKL